MRLGVLVTLGLIAIGVSPTANAFAGSTTSDASGFGVDPCYQQCHPVQIAQGNKAFKSCMNICQSGGAVSGGSAPVSSAGGAYGPDTCASGYVWREAIPSDHVCVTPQSRALVRHENRSYRSLVDVHGAYGSNSCISGYVWRQAFNGDAVCVTPDRRSAVLEENAEASSHLAN